MNRITNNSEYKAAFIDWATDHYEHFDCYPGSFVHLDNNNSDIEFTEQEIWDALEGLIDKDELQCHQNVMKG